MVSGQGTTSLAATDGPLGICLYPQCVEVECCGFGTTWDGNRCSIGSPSFDGVYPDGYVHECVKHICFDAQCCGLGTVYRDSQCYSEDRPPFLSSVPFSEPTLPPSIPSPTPTAALVPTPSPTVTNMPSVTDEPTSEPSKCPPEPEGEDVKSEMIEKRDPDVLPSFGNNWEVWDPPNNRYVARVVERWTVSIRVKSPPGSPIEIKVKGQEGRPPAEPNDKNNQGDEIMTSLSSMGDQFQAIKEDDVYQELDAEVSTRKDVGAGSILKTPRGKAYKISGCIVLHHLNPPGWPPGYGLPSQSAPFNPNEMPPPGAEDYRRIDANGRWIIAEYIIEKVAGALPEITTLKVTQQPRTAADKRKCTPPKVN